MKVYLGPYKEDDSSRKESIHLHDYDTWNMDHTLALIALPMLKQLKETKHGVPGYIDSKDMPEHLMYTPRQYDPRAVGDLFNNWDDFDDEFQRQVEVWDWIMDEMIWSMEQVLEDSIEHELDTEHHDRVYNGLKLFGKYYRSLWD